MSLLLDISSYLRVIGQNELVFNPKGKLDMS